MDVYLVNRSGPFSSRAQKGKYSAYLLKKSKCQFARVRLRLWLDLGLGLVFELVRVRCDETPMMKFKNNIKTSIH